MNKSEFRSLIREEIKKIIAEAKDSALDKVKTREDVIDLIVKEFPDQKNKKAGMKSNTKFWTMNRLMNHYRELSNKKPKSEIKEASEKSFKAFGGVHSDKQLDDMEEYLQMTKSKDPKVWEKYIAGLEKKGYDKSSHKEHPHYKWAVKKLKSLK